MRASLPYPISRRRWALRSRGGHRPSPAHEPGVEVRQTDVEAQATGFAERGAGIAAQPTDIATQADLAAHDPAAQGGADIAAQRVRAAGGPTDLAYYSCQCGYLFTAAVSTSVGCPHCGTTQAW